MDARGGENSTCASISPATAKYLPLYGLKLALTTLNGTWAFDNILNELRSRRVPKDPPLLENRHSLSRMMTLVCSAKADQPHTLASEAWRQTMRGCRRFDSTLGIESYSRRASSVPSMKDPAVRVQPMAVEVGQGHGAVQWRGWWGGKRG